ncbi:hypothetical protein F4777DRAFT_105400 [Nemania sp. FL0916]|nr:hypothetical protein F4777DRAFT_105400 [Nemania sp. FL0916]
MRHFRSCRDCGRGIILMLQLLCGTAACESLAECTLSIMLSQYMRDPCRCSSYHITGFWQLNPAVMRAVLSSDSISQQRAIPSPGPGASHSRIQDRVTKIVWLSTRFGISMVHAAQTRVTNMHVLIVANSISSRQPPCRFYRF